MKINWKKFEKFKSVAGFKSLNKASKKLNVSQSTVSRDIIALERSLKINLYERHTSGVKLTKTGIELLKIINEFDQKIQRFKKKYNDEPSLKTIELKNFNFKDKKKAG